MTASTIIFLTAAYLIPLAGLTWLYKKNPGYAFLGVVILAAAFGVGDQFS